MREEVRRFSRALDACPCAFAGNPLHLLFVEDARPIRSGERYLRKLASPQLLEERRDFLINNSTPWGFPVFEVRERPDPWMLSESLFQNFDRAKEVLMTQSKIAEYLESKVKALDPDIVILMIADGLSYYDLPDGTSQPCLVNGVTITEFGYREVVGRPSLSQRLFGMGYRNQKAFTYFDVSGNALAADLHSTFGDSQVVRVAEFAEALNHEAVRMPRGYLQVTTTGLDGLCHHHRDRPPIARYIADLLERFEHLVEMCSRRNRKVLACLTADHGILWRDVLRGREQLIDSATAEDNFHPRYLKGPLLRDYARPAKGVVGTVSLLTFPYLTRAIKRTEWGVHGGISAWESLVPLKIVTT